MMSSFRHFAALIALAASTLAAGCGGAFCPSSGMDEAVSDADTVLHFGCDHNRNCEEDGSHVCWEEAAEQLPDKIESGETFTVRDPTHQTPGGFDENVWVVEEDGSGVYYDQDAGGDVGPEIDACNTDRQRFDPIVRQNDGTVELRTSYGWRTLEEARSNDHKCNPMSGPRHFTGEWITSFNSERREENAVATGPDGTVYAGGMVDTGGDSRGDGFVIAYSDAGDQQWKQVFHTSARDAVTDVATGPDGDLVAVGWTAGQLAGGGTDEHDPDLFVAKISANGEHQWSRQIGSESDDEAEAVTIDDEGNLYIVGQGDRRFDPDLRADSRGFVLKLTTDGETRWSTSVGPMDRTRATGVALDEAGRAYVAGRTRGAFDDSDDTGYEHSPFVAALTTDGKKEWARVFGTSGENTASSIAAGPDRLYISGETAEALGDRSFGGGETDGYVAAFTPSGDPSWTRHLGGEANDRAHDLVVTSEALHVVGMTGDRLAERDSVRGSRAGFLAEYTLDGERQSARFIDSAGGEIGTGVAVDDDGTRFVTGYSDTNWQDRSFDAVTGGFLARY